MQNLETPATRQLPSIADLHKDIQEAFKNDQLNLLLNQPPSEAWLKAYPAEMKIKGDKKYLPIDKVDFLLKYIFGRTKIEVLDAKQINDSMHITVRIWYKDPITGEWDFQDGVGAHPIYPNAGGVKTSTAIAKQTAKKDAADELGAVFGRDLGRKDTVMFAGPIKDPGYSESHVNGNGTNGTAQAPKENSFQKRYREAHETEGGVKIIQPEVPTASVKKQDDPIATPSFTFNASEL